ACTHEVGTRATLACTLPPWPIRQDRQAQVALIALRSMMCIPKDIGTMKYATGGPYPRSGHSYPRSGHSQRGKAARPPPACACTCGAGTGAGEPNPQPARPA
ncbi:MAG: hypothetical protein ABSF99_09435, partial [Anaerolineales bacterium]